MPHHHSKSHHHKDKNSVSTAAVVRHSYILGVLIALFVSFQVVLVFLATLPPRLLLMSVLTIAGYAVTGACMILWCFFLVDLHKFMKPFLLAFLLFFLASLLRGLFSVWMLFSLLHGPYADLVYYAAEAPVYLTVALLLAAIYKCKYAKKPARLRPKTLRYISRLVSLLCAVRAAVSMYFISLCFNPSSLYWLFYTADTLVWLSMFLFFLLYGFSHLASTQMRVYHSDNN